MIRLYDKTRMKELGTISEEELQFLIDKLVEEAAADRDYYMDRETLDYLVEQGMGDHLKKLIENGMAGQDSVEILYKREE